MRRSKKCPSRFICAPCRFSSNKEVRQFATPGDEGDGKRCEVCDGDFGLVSAIER